MKARPVFQGASWRVAMRCVERKFLLTPSPEVVAAIGFCLAVATNRYRIMVHALSVMANHIHLDVTDPYGEISAFRRDFKSLLARCLNCHYGRWEYFWSPRDGLQEISSEEAAVRGMAYTITNPVVAGLVAQPAAWPGLTTQLGHLGASKKTSGAFTFKRPAFFFKQDGDLPETATLRLAPHPLAGDSKAFVAKVIKRVREIISAKQKQLRADGQRFAGARAVLRRRHDATPDTETEHRELNPRFAEPDPERRICRLIRYKAWLADYAQALKLWRETGEAIFPAGTNKMRTYPGVMLRPQTE